MRNYEIRQHAQNAIVAVLIACGFIGLAVLIHNLFPPKSWTATITHYHPNGLFDVYKVKHDELEIKGNTIHIHRRGLVLGGDFTIKYTTDTVQ